MDKLTVALPKGRMQDEVLDLFRVAGYPTSADAGRKLVFEDDTGRMRFVLAKPVDVPIYVEHGAADMGVAGEDTLREENRDLYEPLGLGLGRCRLSLAGPPEARGQNLRIANHLRIATKFPVQARAYLQQQGIVAEIIHLNGSIELAPAVGLADLIIDLIQSGTTLRENGLVELETIMASQAMLVVNRASHKLRFETIKEIIRRLSLEVQRREREVQTV